jgi:hypothetical protein
MTSTLSAITASIILESDIEMGLMAQEVEATLAKHGLGNSGMVVQPDDKGYLYLRYNDLLAPMIRAIQELDDASEAKDEQIAFAPAETGVSTRRTSRDCPKPTRADSPTPKAG